jgi:hypothetical protein
VHHEPPEVTWPLPELDAGVDDGELRPLDEELPDEEPPDEEDLLVLLEELEPVLPVPDVAWCVLLAAEPGEEWDSAAAAPGSVNATAPAAIRLAAAAETVAVRSRALPRSLASTACETLC